MKGLIMERNRTAGFYMLIAVLPIVLCAVSLFPGCETKRTRKNSRAEVDYSTELSEHNRKIAQLLDEISKQERKLGEQEKKLSKLSEDFSRQEKNVLDHGKKLLDLQEIDRKLDRLKSKLGGIEKGQVGKISEPNMARLEKLIKDQIAQNVKRAEVPKIGVVNVQQVFVKCKRNEQYMKKALDERTKLESELTEMKQEIDADEAGLKKLKPGSADRIDRVREVLDKRGQYQAKKQFYELQIKLKDQRWSEQLYKDILRITQEVAAEKDLAFVLEKSEPELPAASAEELRLIIRTHKVLYSGTTIDISDEVLTRLDTAEQNSGQ